MYIYIYIFKYLHVNIYIYVNVYVFNGLYIYIHIHIHIHIGSHTNILIPKINCEKIHPRILCGKFTVQTKQSLIFCGWSPEPWLVASLTSLRQAMERIPEDAKWKILSWMMPQKKKPLNKSVATGLVSSSCCMFLASAAVCLHMLRASLSPAKTTVALQKMSRNLQRLNRQHLQRTYSGRTANYREPIAVNTPIPTVGKKWTKLFSWLAQPTHPRENSRREGQESAR